ncbi:MAG: ribonuclease H-like domain-containing protein [Christensenellales bacterium]|jgi:uncharacterized protein YprB with RNaseH-like and TPR domain
MASMLDRLRAAQPISETKQKVTSNTAPMLVRETRAQLKPGYSHISAQTLQYLGVDAEESIPIDKFLFIDTETTGLRGGAGTVAFLIGAACFTEESLVVKQFLIRDYHQEAAMLRQVFDMFHKARCLVTFNGASFDMPLLESRATVNRLQDRFDVPMHLDMIHAARRVFKMRIRQCSLAAIEERVFGESREDDLPGAEIPARYFKYLKTRDESLLDPVLLHNQTDIISLARLMLCTAQLHENPMASPYHQDIFSLGKVYEKHGQVGKAAICYRACTQRDVRALAGIRLADMLKRLRENQAAADAYEALIAHQTVSTHVFTALAKIYEHRLKEPARALAIVKQGMLYCAEHRQISKRAAQDYVQLEHRYLRLLRKVEKQNHGIFNQDKSKIGASETSERPGG